MPLGPKEMGDVIVRNLAQKTGHDLDYWMDLLRSQDYPDRKTAIADLKTTYALGHFQAQTVWNRFHDTDPYANPAALRRALFATPTQRALLQHLEEFLLSLGDDVSPRPCRTYLPFYRTNTFAAVRPLDESTLEVALDPGENLPGLRTGTDIPNRMTHHFRLPAGEDLTAAQRTALQRSYARN